MLFPHLYIFTFTCICLFVFYWVLYSYVTNLLVNTHFCFLFFQTDERRIVSHLQFTTWPDHSSAKLSEQLVKFICYMRKAHRRGPVVAHCSAGIGRSGVLLCVEILLSYIEKDLYVSTKQMIDRSYSKYKYYQYGCQQNVLIS